jgi:hypothetical protein
MDGGFIFIQPRQVVALGAHAVTVAATTGKGTEPMFVYHEE